MAKYASKAVSMYLDYGQPVEILTHKKWDILHACRYVLLKLCSMAMNGNKLVQDRGKRQAVVNMLIHYSWETIIFPKRFLLHEVMTEWDIHNKGWLWMTDMGKVTGSRHGLF